MDCPESSCYKIVAYSTPLPPIQCCVRIFRATASSCENQHWSRGQTGMGVPTNVTSIAGPFCCVPWAGAHKHRHVALRMLTMLRAFGHPVQHMSYHRATMLQDVALKCCERLASPSN